MPVLVALKLSTVNRTVSRGIAKVSLDQLLFLLRCPIAKRVRLWVLMALNVQGAAALGAIGNKPVVPSAKVGVFRLKQGRTDGAPDRTVGPCMPVILQNLLLLSFVPRHLFTLSNYGQLGTGRNDAPQPIHRESASQPPAQKERRRGTDAVTYVDCVLSSGRPAPHLEFELRAIETDVELHEEVGLPENQRNIAPLDPGKC